MVSPVEEGRLIPSRQYWVLTIVSQEGCVIDCPGVGLISNQSLRAWVEHGDAITTAGSLPQPPPGWWMRFLQLVVCLTIL